jgi:hypothetical protein
MKYLSLFIGTILTFALSNFPVHAALSEVLGDPQAAQQWKEKREASIRELQAKPKAERIAGLSGMLRQLKTLNYRDSPERDEITTALQKALISTPEHAKYFIDKIEESWTSNAERVRTLESQPEWLAAMEEVEQAEEISLDMFYLLGRMWGDYEKVCVENLGMLGHIPSTESVRALGHYLQKREEPGIKTHSPDTSMPAAESLTELISDGPMQKWQASFQDVPKWRKWFDEVKAGKRNFRFKGDPTEYDLDGPASKDKLSRVATATRRDAERAETGRESRAVADGNSSATIFTSPVLNLGVFAGLALVAGVIWYFMRRCSVRR